MSSPIYSNVNAQTSLQTAMFNKTEIDDADEILSNLRAHRPVSSSALGGSTAILASKRNHQQDGQGCDLVISAMYESCPGAESQADIVGSLVAPEHADLVTALLNMPENDLATRLGHNGQARLLDAANTSNAQSRTTRLLEAAQEHLGIAPGRFEDEGHLDKLSTQSASGQDITGWLSSNLSTAIQHGDTKAIATILNGIPESGLPALSNQIADQFGDQARPVLNELNKSSDARTKQFAFSTLDQIGQANLHSKASSVTSTSQDQTERSANVDMSSLETLLMAPQANLATLARQFSGVPDINAHLIKLMIR